MKKIVLFLVIENDNNKGCGGSGGDNQPHYHRLLESELELCLTYWCKSATNSLYNIDIKLICPNNNPPESSFIQRIEKQYPQLEYIHRPHDIADTFPAGWFNVPLAGKVLEEECDYDIAIHIDLDMLLLRDFDFTLFEDMDKVHVKCAVYDENYKDDYEEMLGIPKEFVTCFIVSTKHSKFYSTWFDIQTKLQHEYEDKYELDIEKDEKLWWEYCNCEEHAVDKMFYENVMPIEKLVNTMLGDSQGYGSAKYHSNHIKDILFLHCHINEGWQQEYKEFIYERIQI